jgi:aspartyl-tRNA(Asn)/glutamyl-tRNA(Gln) amidotransferase subunit B
MVKIGLEIHGYLKTKEKLFCKCNAIHGAKFTKPNTNICPICTGQPGAKPMLPNKEAINKAIKISLILGCKINPKLVWQRKHYDWPDLPKGYQNTISGTYASPLGEKGKFLGIRITEAHIEEDPASWNPNTGEIDYNKSGYSLIEIVTEPDFTSSKEVIGWMKQLVGTLVYMKAIDKNLGIKADVNVSIKNGERIEMKNINSLKNIKAAIDFELQRQKKSGELPKKQETRMFDENKGITIKMREKELAEDYRFISEPDLPVIKLEKTKVNEVKKSIPEMPQKKITRLVKKHKIGEKHEGVLTKNLDVVEFFENIVEKTNPLLATNWVTGELLRVLNYSKKELHEVNIQHTHFVELLNLIEKKVITELKAKEILNSFIPNSFSLKQTKAKPKTIKASVKVQRPKVIISEIGVISNKKELEKIAKKIIKENPKAISDYKKGKQEALNFLIGQMMRASKKRADYNIAKKILIKNLE